MSKGMQYIIQSNVKWWLFVQKRCALCQALWVTLHFCTTRWSCAHAVDSWRRHATESTLKLSFSMLSNVLKSRDTAGCSCCGWPLQSVYCVTLLFHKMKKIKEIKCALYLNPSNSGPSQHLWNTVEKIGFYWRLWSQSSDGAESCIRSSLFPATERLWRNSLDAVYCVTIGGIDLAVTG